jgi:hypothetical protein
LSDRNAIAQELTVEQLDAFVSALAAKPGKERTLAAIQQLAAQMGITISLMSAKAFRDTTFERHLQKIRAAQSIAMQVEEIEGGGNTMADASAKLISKRIFQKLMEMEEDEDAGIDIDELTLALSRLRQGDVQKAALAAKLREYEAREKERAEKSSQARRQLEAVKKTGGLSADALAQIEEAAALL